MDSALDMGLAMGAGLLERELVFLDKLAGTIDQGFIVQVPGPTGRHMPRCHQGCTRFVCIPLCAQDQVHMRLGNCVTEQCCTCFCKPALRYTSAHYHHGKASLRGSFWDLRPCDTTKSILKPALLLWHSK